MGGKKIPVLKPAEVVSRLGRLGFVEVRKIARDIGIAAEDLVDA